MTQENQQLEQLVQRLAALEETVALQTERIVALEAQVEQESFEETPQRPSFGQQNPVLPAPSEGEQSAEEASPWDQEEALEAALLPLAQALSEAYDFSKEIKHPADLERHEALMQGALLLAQSSLTPRSLLQYIGSGDHLMFGPMALEALLLRKVNERPIFDAVCARLPDLEERGLHFALRYLTRVSTDGKLTAIFARASSWWSSEQTVRKSLRRAIQFLEWEENFERVVWPSLSDVQRKITRAVLESLDMPILAGAIRALDAPPADLLDREKLGRIGKIWTEEFNDELIVTHAQMERDLEQMEALLTGPSRRSVVLVGRHGVGKTVAVQQLCRRLSEKDWILFEASAADVLSGQRYIGELESRVGQLIDMLQGPKPIIWYIPDFHELLEKGATQQDPTGILDLLLPAIERQRILVLGETRPEAFARLLRARNKLRYAVEAINMESLDLETTVEMARSWALKLEQKLGYPAVLPGVIEEAVQLSLQYFADRSLPGSIMHLLQIAQMHKQLHAQTPASEEPLNVKDLLETIAQLTHLPANVLDDRQRMDIDSLRELFRHSVIGQDEAVDCLVDRIAMMKAGLTDPSRPLGVFLFAGPTGTGKTELGKTLCRFLFGSEQHMIRLDMSEYQERNAYWRLIQEGEGGRQARSLATQIREQPFSIVLLDEIEKAHPQVWDLFLQVFDDGRLSDQNGEVIDFRHCMIILTSNVGSTIPKGPGMGFTSSAEKFAADGVYKAIEQTFRREFLNRIDRVVVFHPLSRGVMRDILHKELNGLLLRRGFRSKDWAVEWGPSALDFLLEKGFTPDLGARPLKRAIERYLLAPLAKTIVEHRFPQGNQFLFVSSDSFQIQVQFIDPDIPEEKRATLEQGVESEHPLSLKSIAFAAQGRRQELEYLEQRWQQLKREVGTPLWASERANTQERVHSKEFLSAQDRHKVLEKLEVMERIEAGIESARGVLRRLHGAYDFPSQSDSMRRLALRIYYLELAARDVLREIPQNAMIHIAGLHAAELPREACFDVFQHIKRMYQGWAEGRRMRSMWLRRGSLDDMQAILVVSGLGAWSVLSGEQGLHVFELPREDGTFYRARVRVRVSHQPTERVGSNQSILTVATDLFAQEESASGTLCRHYRWAPTPLVRDHVAQWRTEQIARVLAGDFDLIDESQ